MSTKPAKLDLRFLVRMDKSSSREYGKFTARIVFVDEGRVRHPSGTYYGSVEAPYADLNVTAQCDLKPSENASDPYRWYAIEFGYNSDCHAVDLRRAEMMVKTLRRVQAKLDKLEAEFGWSQDVYVTMTRVASALGIKSFALADSYTGDRYGQPMVEDYAWTDANGIKYALDAAHQTLVNH